MSIKLYRNEKKKIKKNSIFDGFCNFKKSGATFKKSFCLNCLLDVALKKSETNIFFTRDSKKKIVHFFFRRPNVYDILTFDEPWINFYEPETKQQSANWLFPDDPRQQIFIVQEVLSKKMISAYSNDFCCFQ